MIWTRGIPTTAGSKILESYVPVFDATVVARCKRARPARARQDEHRRVRDGLVDRELGLRPVAQPVGPDARPGRLGRRLARPRSRRGLAPWALGSDTGGSIKQPVAFCGNVGLRPTYGTVSRYGVVAFASSLDQVGPVARNVRDYALLYSIISGRDENDSTTVDVPPVELPDGDDLKGVRIGVPRQLNEVEGIEPGVKAAVDAAIELAESLGAEVGECALPLSVDYGLACYYLIAPAEASANLARYDGVRYGLRADGDDFREMVMRTRHDGLRRRAEAPDHARHVRALVRLLRRVLRHGAEGAHGDQARARRALRALRRARLADVPDDRVPARREGRRPARDVPDRRAHDPVEHGRACRACPSRAASRDGLPVGLQLIGPQFSENTLFRVAHALEQAIGFDVVPERLR